MAPIHVDESAGSDETGKGTPEAPYQTLAFAVYSHPEGPYAIRKDASGTYRSMLSFPTIWRVLEIIPSCPPSCTRVHHGQYLRVCVVRWLAWVARTHLADLELRQFLDIGVGAEGRSKEIRQRLQVHLCSCDR